MKGKPIESDTLRGTLATFLNQLVNVSVIFQKTVSASNTDSLFRQSVWSLYLPLGSIRTLFLIIYQNSSRGRGLLSSLGIKETKAPGFLEPAAASVSKRVFRLRSALGIENFVAFK